MKKDYTKKAFLAGFFSNFQKEKNFFSTFFTRKFYITIILILIPLGILAQTQVGGDVDLVTGASDTANAGVATITTITESFCDVLILDSFDIEGYNALGYSSIPVGFPMVIYNGDGTVSIMDFGGGVWYEYLSPGGEECFDLSDYDYVEIEYRVTDSLIDFWLAISYASSGCGDTSYYSESNRVQFRSVETGSGIWTTSKYDLTYFDIDRTTALAFMIGGIEKPSTIEFSSIQFGCYDSPAPIIDSLTLPSDPTDISQTIEGIAAFSGTNIVSASWDWGDSNSSSGIISDSSILGSHNYNAPGVYEVVLTIVDANGKEDSFMYQYVVIYDPSAGFVTGGGWINSPEGAYVLDPSLTGKATFGFVSKYKKGQSIPDGNTEFQFHAANMNFKSTAYEWLIVAGTKAMFKGSGTINGEGNYQFILSAKDENKKGGEDTFRIKISSSGGLVYDNQMGLADNEYSSVGIAEGSIIVHDNKSNTKSKQAEILEAVNSVFPNTFEVEAYPNPSNGTFSLNILNSSSYDEVNITVYDMFGTLVYEKSGDIFKTYSFGDQIATGVYILNVTIAGELKTLKLIKE